MKTQLIGYNSKSLKKIPFASAALFLSLFLPFIQIPKEGIHVSGLEIILGAAAMPQDVSPLISVLVILLIGGTTLAVMLTSVLLVVKVTKNRATAAIITYGISFLSAALILFFCAKVINTSGILESRFYIKNLGAGFWLMLFSGLVGLVLSMRARKISPGYIVLIILSIVWLFPIVWIIIISFRGESGSFTSYFWPKEFTLKNYIVLLTDSSKFPYLRWFGNTLFVAVSSCVVTTFIVLSTAFTLSRIRFKGRQGFMNIVLVLGMFPGFMSMIAVYYILKGMNLTQSLIALIMVYSGGAAMGYYIAKGFFDTIPKALDEAACIDGATKWELFTKITIPISKPIIIYTILTSFMSPWADYIFAKVIMGDDYEHYTVALGLYTMLSRENIDTWYTRFAAGAVLISIPVAALFIVLQKYYVEGLSGSVKG